MSTTDVKGKVSYECATDNIWWLAKKVKDLFYESCKPLTLNEIGDFLAGSLSFVALVWFALGFFWQAREFSLQRKEYSRNVDLLGKQIDQAINRDSRESEWQETKYVLDEVKVCREKIDQIISVVQYVYDRYPDINSRKPQSLAAVASVIATCIDMVEGGHDPSDEDLLRTRRDLDEIHTQLNYVLNSIEQHDIATKIPLSNNLLRTFKSIMTRYEAADLDF
ncbi:MAG: hypothetical protein AB8D52_11760 [Gammaproteobacteria bacterium]